MKAGASVKRSGTRRPWLQRTFLNRALKVRNIKRQLFRSFRASRSIALLPEATRLTLFGACPWLSYFAPLALPWRLLCKASSTKRWLRSRALSLSPKARQPGVRSKTRSAIRWCGSHHSRPDHSYRRHPVRRRAAPMAATVE